MKLQIGKEPSLVEDADYIFITPEDMINVDAASCMHIRLNNTLDLYQNRVDILKVALSKIRYGGNISISGIDIHILSRFMYDGRYTNAELNSLLFAQTSYSDVHEMIDLLQASGFVIETIRIEDIRYYLQAVRPTANA